MIDAAAIARDTSALVQAPSLTGDERPAFERLGELAAALGLEPELHEHDLAALRAHPDHPGEEAPREELLGLTVTLPGTRAGRVCLNGHIDVVGPGSAPWRHGPFSGVIEDGYVHGRGSVDMKGGVVAALHALAELREGEQPEVVLQAVGSEEDGGLGTFAALERDAAFDACAAHRADRLRGRLRAGRRADLPRHRARARRPRRDAARGPLGDRPLRRPAPARSRRTSGR